MGLYKIYANDTGNGLEKSLKLIIWRTSYQQHKLSHRWWPLWKERMPIVLRHFVLLYTCGIWSRFLFLGIWKFSFQSWCRLEIIYIHLWIYVYITGEDWLEGVREEAEVLTCIQIRKSLHFMFFL